MSTKSQNRLMPLFCGIALLLCNGIVYAWSVFQDAVIPYFNWNSADAAYTFSIAMASNFIGIMLGGISTDRFGPQRTILVGGILNALGMLASSVVPTAHPDLLYLTYGFIRGVGSGFIYNASLTCVQRWWPEKRGTVSGILLFAYGSCTVLFAPLLNFLLGDSGIGLIGTFRALACLFGAVTLVTCRWMVFPGVEETPSKRSPSKSSLKVLQEMIHMRQYWLILGILFCLTPAYNIFNPILKTLSMERGLSEATAITAIMLTGVASAMGRLLIPWMTDKIRVRNCLYFMFSITLIGVVGLFFVEGLPFILMAIGLSFAYGGCSSITSVLAFSYFNSTRQGTNLGGLVLGPLLSGLLVPLLAKSLNQLGGLGIWSFLCPAVACLVGIFFVALLGAPVSSARTD